MPLQSLEKLKAHLNERRLALGSWEAVATEIGVSLGSTVRVANGYEPRRPALRKSLGLPALLTVPACQKCGQLHVSKRCSRRASFEENDRAYQDWKREHQDLLAQWLAALEKPQSEGN